MVRHQRVQVGVGPTILQVNGKVSNGEEWLGKVVVQQQGIAMREA